MILVHSCSDQSESRRITNGLNLSCRQNGVASGSPGAADGGGDSLLNPPSVASLLDISLPGPPEEAPGEAQTHISDSIIELAINSAQYGA